MKTRDLKNLMTMRREIYTMCKNDENICEFDVNGTEPQRNSYAVSKTGMKVGNHVRMRDDEKQDSDLRGFIRFGDGGFVRSIELVSDGDAEEQENPQDCYAYRINVIAAGPKKGWGKLVFIDRSTDTYTLSIYDSSEKKHFVRYNSANPDIIAILWSDDN